MLLAVPDFRVIPAIEALRQRDGVRELEASYGADATVKALRAGADRLRAGHCRRQRARGRRRGRSAASRAARATALAAGARGSLRPVINATGVVIHTNLGRAPIAAAALERVAAIAGGYSNLEYDLADGTRGSRTVHAESLITALTGAEAAVVVNNNAAATLLILTGLANGREVVISRGELVEIGGGFRVPDVMRQSGATLREVGTTNRTRVNDYTATVTPATAMFLRVHPSNFRIEGFTERPSLADLVRGRARDRRAGGRRHRQRLPGRRPRRRAVGAGVDRRRRRPGVLQRRQAARRSAVRHHRRPQGAGRSAADASADAGAARRQDHLCHPGGHARGVRRRPRGGDHARAANAARVGRRDRGAGAGPWRAAGRGAAGKSR